MDGLPNDSSLAAALWAESSGLDPHGIGGGSVGSHGGATEEPRDDQFCPSDVATEVSWEFDPEARQPSVMNSDKARGAESSLGGGEWPPSVGGSPNGEQWPSLGDDAPLLRRVRRSGRGEVAR